MRALGALDDDDAALFEAARTTHRGARTSRYRADRAGPERPWTTIAAIGRQRRGLISWPPSGMDAARRRRRCPGTRSAPSDRWAREPVRLSRRERRTGIGKRDENGPSSPLQASPAWSRSTCAGVLARHPLHDDGPDIPSTFGRRRGTAHRPRLERMARPGHRVIGVVVAFRVRAGAMRTWVLRLARCRTGPVPAPHLGYARMSSP